MRGLRRCVFVMGFFLAGVLTLGSHASSQSIPDALEMSSLTGKGDQRWGRDPFYRERPAENTGMETSVGEPPEEDTGRLFLSAIIFRDGFGTAIIDGRIVRPGDEVGEGYVVSQILQNKVLLLKGRQKRLLEVQAFGGS